MTDTNNVKLYVWKGDWGLPSVDTNCLFVLAYAKFNSIHVPLTETTNPWKTPRGELPILRSNNNTADSPKKIIEYFDKCNSTECSSLNAKQLADVSAFEALVMEKLYPALQWLDQKNLTEFTRPWYFKAIPFPINIYYTRKFEQHARDLIECLYPNNEDFAALETEIYSDAQKCITLLSTRLGTSNFFFGNDPSRLDAVLYSYLAPLLMAPLHSKALQNHLKACTNLINFVTRISCRYFDAEQAAYKQLKAEENKHKTNGGKNEFPNKLRNQILAVTFATCAMLGYGFSNGILKVPVRRNKNLGDGNDYSEDMYEVDYDDFYD